MLRVISVLLVALLLSGFRTDVADHLNAHRKTPLIESARLMQAAQARAEEVGRAGVVPYGHPGWDKTVGRFYPVVCAAETVTIVYDQGKEWAVEKGWTDRPGDIVSLFQQSPRHWAILTSGRYTLIGVGHAPYTGEWYDHVVVILVGSC